MEQTRYLSSLNSPATLQPEPRRPGVIGPALLFGLATSSRFPIPSKHTAHHSVAYSKLSHLRYFSAVASSAGRLRQTASFGVAYHQFKHRLPRRDPHRLSGACSTPVHDHRISITFPHVTFLCLKASSQICAHVSLPTFLSDPGEQPAHSRHSSSKGY